MDKLYCEICTGVEFYQYEYPIHTQVLKKKIFLRALRRYGVNVVKFFARAIVSMLPNSFLPELKKRIRNPYKRIQSFHEVFSTLKKINTATRLFKGRKIVVCKKCDLGTVYPRISENELVQYYKHDYWIANMGELEPAESNRTKITHKLLKDAIDLKQMKSMIEFGSASAHLSRYIKSKESAIDFDAVDPGIVWKEVLKKEIREVYTDIDEINTTYDVLMSSHALEHISSLDRYFGKFRNLLNQKGYLYFEIPNSEERELIFQNTPDFHLPHTYFFTPKSFESIASKFGFTPIFIKTFSRSYRERFSGTHMEIQSIDEHEKGAYLRVLLQKL